MVPETRLELKYLVPTRIADAVAAAVSPICDLDPKAGGDPDGYHVTSLYFETSGFDFYHMNTSKSHRRLKPRVRYYGMVPTGNVFLELKRKASDTVKKARKKLPVERWPRVLTDQTLHTPFLDCVHTRGAKPLVHVRYRRVALVSAIDSYARVTFDYELSSAPAFGDSNLHLPAGDFSALAWTRNNVVLELKCLHPAPSWMVQLVRRFELKQRGFSKYKLAVEADLRT